MTKLRRQLAAAILVSLTITTTVSTVWIFNRYKDVGTLSTQRQILQVLIEQSKLAIFELDGDGRIVDANPEAIQLIGRERKELLEKPIDTILSRESAERANGLIRSKIGNKDYVEFYADLVLGDGEQITRVVRLRYFNGSFVFVMR